jgi:hypothetical protein
MHFSAMIRQESAIDMLVSRRREETLLGRVDHATLFSSDKDLLTSSILRGK